MLSPFARALAYYLAGGFALLLLCSIWLFDQPAALDATWRRRLRRRSLLLSPLGLVHPLFALTALVLARDAAAQDDGDTGEAPPAVLIATGSCVVSLVTTTAVLLSSG